MSDIILSTLHALICWCPQSCYELSTVIIINLQWSKKKKIRAPGSKWHPKVHGGNKFQGWGYLPAPGLSIVQTLQLHTCSKQHKTEITRMFGVPNHGRDIPLWVTFSEISSSRVLIPPVCWYRSQSQTTPPSLIPFHYVLLLEMHLWCLIYIPWIIKWLHH